MKLRLIDRTPRRLFAFGCSFTRYGWTTWPDIVSSDLGIDFYYNLGLPGAGNELIFNRLMQVDGRYALGLDDLVMLCWTNTCREDRFVNGGWISPGNIYSQKEYPRQFVERYYSDPASVSLHDYAFIHASRSLLELRGCQFHFMQMLDLLTFHDQWTSDRSGSCNDLLRSEVADMAPSFYDVLWDNDIEARHAKEHEKYGYFDGHPSPAEHLFYLQQVFDHEWKQETIDAIAALEDEHHRARISGKNEFNRLRYALPTLDIN